MAVARVLTLAAMVTALATAGVSAQTTRATVLQLPRLVSDEARGTAASMAAPNDPVSILPGPAANAASLPLTVVPKPHLRPPMPLPAIATRLSQPNAPQTVDRTVTAAIDPAQEAAAPTPAPTASAAAPAAAPAARVIEPAAPPAISAPPQPVAAQPVAESDTLLGDPATLYTSPVPIEPQAPQPQGIALPRANGASSAAAALLPSAAGNEPYQRVRQLQALQDRLAQGSVESLGAQRMLIAAMDQAFAAADPKLWSDPRNAVAAVAFVLSGGPPTVLKKLAALDPKPAVDERLVNGVLAYAEGREADALSLLGPLDAINLPPSIAAQIAMAQSALVVKTDAQVTMHLLAMARLLAPGTLVEEAAIRRQIFVADQLRDDKTVQSLARQYLDRFRHSVYAGNFRDRFAAALSHMDFVNDPAQFPRLDDMLASVEPAGRAELYLTIALAGVVSGRTNAANLASTRVIALSAPASPIQTRARLYRAAALVASAKTFDAARTDYAAVDRKTLSPSDQALFDAVGEAIAAVRSGTEITAKPPPPGTDPDQPSTVMTRAATTLKTIDALLAAK